MPLSDDQLAAKAAPKGALSGQALEDDWKYDLALRPRDFGEFVGQAQVVANLRVALAAAKKTGEVVDHILLSGPPGLGKTTLAMLLAEELGLSLRSTSGMTLDKPGDLVGILSSLEPRALFFIDEIHALKRGLEEYLHAAMTDFSVDILLDSGPYAKTLQLDLKPFTLVGATTREGKLSGPFRSRFVIRERLDFYQPGEVALIVKRSAALLRIAIDEDAALALAQASRGTPRTANRLLRLVRYVALAQEQDRISAATVRAGLANNRIDERGLGEMDRRFLRAIAQGGGVPVGLKTISEIVEEEVATLEAHYEPFLLQQGLLMKTPRGRTLTPEGWKLTGVAGPTDLFAPA